MVRERGGGMAHAQQAHGAAGSYTQIVWGCIKPRGEAGSKKAEQAERRPYMVTTRDAGQAVVAIPRLPVAIVDPKRRTLSISFRH
jgi:hypothetical protein